MEPIVKSLLLHRYRSFVSEQVDFDNPTFFVGQNGSGKSNLVDALAFLSEAMTSPLSSVVGKRGGLAVKYRRHTGIYGRRLALGVVLGRLGRGIAGARYAFAVDTNKRGYEVVREQCVIRLADGNRHWFDRSADGYRSSVSELTLAIDADSLVMPILGGDKRFAPVLRALAGIRVYTIDPARLREPQDANGRAGLEADGANTAAVLMGLLKAAPSDLDEVSELVAAIVPGVTRVQPVPYGTKLLIEFLQRWGPRGVVKLNAADMSDGTLRALGLLAAAYQQPVPTVMAVEEPEATVHPGAIGALLDILHHAAARSQLVVTTHNSELLDHEAIDDRHLRIVTWDEGESHVNCLAESSREALRRHFMGAGELLRSNALDAAPSSVRERSAAPRLFEEEL